MKAEPGQVGCILCNEKVPEIIIPDSGWDYNSLGWLCPTCNIFRLAAPRLIARIKELATEPGQDMLIIRGYLECLRLAAGQLNVAWYRSTLKHLREFEVDFNVQLTWLHELEI